MGLGRGKNNFSKLITTKYTIQYALEKQCRNLQLFGDSKIVCNWINKTADYNANSLRHIMDEIHRLINIFDTFVCHHIYKKRNTVVDLLSKETAHRPIGIWMIQEQRDGTFHQRYHRPYIDITD